MIETDFARALLDPEHAVPPGLTGPQGGPVTQRFAVYRNNVTQGLTEALDSAFPVVRKLVGAAFFAAMAREFLRRHPPESPVLMLYGREFPGFLAKFPPVAHLGYLPDVARLEQALRESYHAADATPLGSADLSRLVGTDPRELRLCLAPSLRLLRSGWPLHAIWVAQTAGGPPPRAEAQDVLVLRPAFDPAPHLLPPGGADAMAKLLAGHPLAEAAGPGLDLTALLTLLIQGQAIIGVLE